MLLITIDLHLLHSLWHIKVKPPTWFLLFSPPSLIASAPSLFLSISLRSLPLVSAPLVPRCVRCHLPPLTRPPTPPPLNLLLCSFLSPPRGSETSSGQDSNFNWVCVVAKCVSSPERLAPWRNRQISEKSLAPSVPFKLHSQERLLLNKHQIPLQVACGNPLHPKYKEHRK